MYEELTFENIMQRMLSRVPDSIDTREGSIIYDALAPTACELAIAYIQLDNIINETFADTASREYLVLRAKERGLTPTNATSAILRGEFSPVSVDVMGCRFNINTLNYLVTEQLSPGVYKVMCETAGTVGNQSIGNMIPIDYVEGLETACLTDVLIPGEDEEDTEVFRQRYMDSFSEAAFGGNKQDYKNKVAAVNGVGASKISPAWNGGGTVKVTILDSDYNCASDALIDTVQNTLDPPPQGGGAGTAPIGHIVTVDAPESIDISITADFVFDTDYSWASVVDQVEEVINDYLLSLRQSWSEQSAITVRVSQIESRLLGITGILDVTGTTINGLQENMQLLPLQVPLFGGVEPQ